MKKALATLFVGAVVGTGAILVGCSQEVCALRKRLANSDRRPEARTDDDLPQSGRLIHNRAFSHQEQSVTQLVKMS